MLKRFLCLVFLLLNTGLYYSQQNNSAFIPHYLKFNINKISTYIYNNGNMDISPERNAGFEYPRGSNKFLYFRSGLLWGAKAGDSIKIGGNSYHYGILPGKILDDGSPENPESDEVRVFRVRPYYANADLTNEIEDGEGTESEIRAQYEKDWMEWPVNRGAPYEVGKNVPQPER